MSLFKAYDIRGVYPDELDERLAFRIGYATARFLQTSTIVIGRDVRHSAPSIARAAANGIMAAGTHVIDIGGCTTPMLYYAVGKLNHGGGIMITASHNPPEYIGMKICREQAIPIGEEGGLRDIEIIARGTEGPNQPNDSEHQINDIETIDLLPHYREHIRSYLNPSRPMTLVVDGANGAVCQIFDSIVNNMPYNIIPLYMTPDGSFPNHEPDPLKDKNIANLRATVVQEKADMGVAFDGDGDRCVFVDNNGERISSDLVTALLARPYLKSQQGCPILYDVRSSRVVREEIEAHGGTPIRERVGHAFMKVTLRKHQAPFGGELSGHYYFASHYYADSGLVAFVSMLNYMEQDHRPLTEIFSDLRRYYASGEINFVVQDKATKIKELADIYHAGNQDWIDGVTVDFPDWWFNLRASNTEPLLRLNLEAQTPQRLQEKLAEMESHIGPREE